MRDDVGRRRKHYMYATLVGGQAFAVVMCIMLLEGIILTVFSVRTGRGVAPLDLLPSLAAGICLLAAATFAMMGAGAGLIGTSLAIALVAHVTDLARRWRTRESIQRSFSGTGPVS